MSPLLGPSALATPLGPRSEPCHCGRLSRRRDRHWVTGCGRFTPWRHTAGWALSWHRSAHPGQQAGACPLLAPPRPARHGAGLQAGLISLCRAVLDEGPRPGRAVTNTCTGACVDACRWLLGPRRRSSGPGPWSWAGAPLPSSTSGPSSRRKHRSTWELSPYRLRVMEPSRPDEALGLHPRLPPPQRRAVFRTRPFHARQPLLLVPRPPVPSFPLPLNHSGLFTMIPFSLHYGHIGRGSEFRIRAAAVSGVRACPPAQRVLCTPQEPALSPHALVPGLCATVTQPAACVQMGGLTASSISRLQILDYLPKTF